MPCAAPLGEPLELARVPAAAAGVEVRRRRPDLDETDLDVHAVTGPDDIAKQAAVLVDAVCRGDYSLGFGGGRSPVPVRSAGARQTTALTSELVR
jgi:hypothetical protein